MAHVLRHVPGRHMPGYVPRYVVQQMPQYVLKHVPKHKLTHMPDKHVLEHELKQIYARCSEDQAAVHC